MKTKILYWTFTGLFAAFMMFSAIPNIITNADSVEFLSKQLGYPVYFIPFIGVAKALGSVAILIPGLRKLKEWAYAGLFFDLIGATWSLISVDKTLPEWGFMVLPLAIGGLSYYLNGKLNKSA